MKPILQALLIVCTFFASSLGAAPAERQHGQISSPGVIDDEAALQNCVTAAASMTAQNNPCRQALASADPVIRARGQSIVALTLASRGDLLQARQLMDQALSTVAADAVVTGNNGSLLLYEQRFADALTAYDAALLMPDAQTAIILKNRSLVQRALGNYAGARDDFADYLQILANRLAPAVQAEQVQAD